MLLMLFNSSIIRMLPKALAKISIIFDVKVKGYSTTRCNNN